MSRGMQRINIRVDGRLKAEIEAEAKARGLSPSDVVREAIDDHLRRRRPSTTCLEIARRLGLIGSAEGLPRDLSTNRDHFEGFGGG
jgi:Arc/MetJ-type ribon-helix-helix transcriptional regulator